jgi:tRNA(fMet)-specific endonuclease VapC
MIRFLLDTDTISLQERGHGQVISRVRAHAPELLAVSVVTVEEALRGRLARLGRQLPPEKLAAVYANFERSVVFFRSVNLVPFDVDCARKAHELRALRIRIGTLDLRIAATALVHGLTVVTRNRADFGRVPGLAIEDWSAG